jgi:hypothetical protein
VQLVIDPCGQTRCLYHEAIDLSALGLLSISRASYVEPDELGQWTADLSPLGGPVLGPFLARSGALAAEESWIRQYWLLTPFAT